jgi:hypothetical protein
VLVYGHQFGLKLVCDYMIRLRSVLQVGSKPSQETLTSSKDGHFHVVIVQSVSARDVGLFHWGDFPQ